MSSASVHSKDNEKVSSQVSSSENARHDTNAAHTENPVKPIINTESNQKTRDILYSVFVGLILSFCVTEFRNLYPVIRHSESVVYWSFVLMILYFVLNSLRYLFAIIDLNTLTTVDDDIKLNIGWRLITTIALNFGVIEMILLAFAALSLFPDMKYYSLDAATKNNLNQLIQADPSKFDPSKITPLLTSGKLLIQADSNRLEFKELAKLFFLFNFMLVLVDILWIGLLSITKSKFKPYYKELKMSVSRWQWSGIIELVVFGLGLALTLLVDTFSYAIFIIMVLIVLILLILESVGIYENRESTP